MMKFSIVTPSFNRAIYLDETIESVIGQAGDFEIEYLVQDGGSGSDVLDKLEFWKRRILNNDFDRKCNSVTFDYVVEKDTGMYDAIRKGFDKTSGEVMAWINTDDMYHSNAFSIAKTAFEEFNHLYWITGIPNSYNFKGDRVGFDKFPEAYSRQYIEKGMYQNKYIDCGMNWIQQESTMWKRVLYENAGKIRTDLRYASDFYLWIEFSKHADLVKVNTFLGGFRVHDEQITANPLKYQSELPKIENNISLRELKSIVDKYPWAYHKYMEFNDKAIQNLESQFGIRREWLSGRVIEWSFDQKKWIEVWKMIF